MSAPSTRTPGHDTDRDLRADLRMLAVDLTERLDRVEQALDTVRADLAELMASQHELRSALAALAAREGRLEELLRRPRPAAEPGS